jgi:hypothetical protein
MMLGSMAESLPVAVPGRWWLGARFLFRVGCRRRADVLRGQFVQAGPLGEGHDRNQAGPRHEMRVIERLSQQKTALIHRWVQAQYFPASSLRIITSALRYAAFAALVLPSLAEKSPKRL